MVNIIYGTGDNPYGAFVWKGAFAPDVSNAQDHQSKIEFKGEWYYVYQINKPQVDSMKCDGEGYAELHVTKSFITIRMERLKWLSTQIRMLK